MNTTTPLSTIIHECNKVIDEIESENIPDDIKYRLIESLDFIKDLIKPKPLNDEIDDIPF